MIEEQFRAKLADIQSQLDKAREDVSLKLPQDFFQGTKLSDAQAEIARRLSVNTEYFDNPAHCERCKEDYLFGIEQAHYMIGHYLSGMLTYPTTLLHINYMAEDNSEGQSVTLCILKDELTVISVLNGFAKEVQKVIKDKAIKTPASELAVLFEGKQYNTSSGMTSVTIFYEEIEAFARPDIVKEVQREVKRKYK